MSLCQAPLPLIEPGRRRCNHRSGFLDRWQHVRLIGHVLRYRQIGAHESQHLSRVERQPGNPGIAARSKDLREQFLLQGNPSARRFVTDKEMPFLPLAQQLRPVIRLGIALLLFCVRRHNLPVRRAEVPGRQFRNRRRLRISLRVVPGHNIQAPGSWAVGCLGI